MPLFRSEILGELWQEFPASSKPFQQCLHPTLICSDSRFSAAYLIFMLMVLILLAILTLIFSAGLPPSIALILSTSVISGAAVTYWFSHSKKYTAKVKIVAEPDAKPEFQKKIS
jgi:hypothetical protein